MLATFVVTTNADFVEGSLRNAIELANDSPGVDEIHFALPPEELKIAPDFELPWLTDSVVIDGTTQPGFSVRPLVELSGENISMNSAGLYIASDDSIVRGLVINNFVNAGVFVGEVSGAVIQSNIIGADPSGSVARPNSAGVSLYGSSNAIVGGGEPALGNLISGNDGYGVIVLGSNATNNRIHGNIIGANSEGTTALANASSGVLLDDGAWGNYVGTDFDNVLDEAEGNVLSGNSMHGVLVRNAPSNFIAGNFIGTDIEGLLSVGNTGHGIWVEQASQNVIGGASPFERNVISGNGKAGIQMRGAILNHVAGNYIGVDVSGADLLGNDEYGVFLRDESNMNIIGTDGDGVNDAAERNVISGNRYAGIFNLDSHQNIFAGNYIGVDSTGSSRAANNVGVRLNSGSTQILVGTNADGVSDDLERNIISGNVRNGLEIDGSDSNQAAGNWIGLGVDGTAVPNRHSGVWIYNGSTANLIGGTSSSQRNVIAGNSFSGVSINAPGNSILGNYIGTSADGMQATGNGREAVLIYDGANGNRVGDGTPEGRNIISGGASDGVHIRNADGNLIIGNSLGLAADESTPLDNSGPAIRLDDASRNTIGGLSAEEFNWFYSAAESAIVVTGQSQDNSLLGMTVQSTHAAPIDLADDGVSANDSGDVDDGPNGLQNFPEILAAVSSAGVTRVTGRVSSTPYSEVDVDLYFAAEESADSLSFVDRARSVRTGPDGIGAWSIELPESDGSFRAFANQQGVGFSEFSPAVSATGVLEVSVASTQIKEQDGELSASVRRAGTDLEEAIVVSLSSTDPARVRVPTQVTIPAGHQSADFPVVLVGDTVAQPTLDVAIVAESPGGSGAAVLTVLRSDVWHNDWVPLDVNDDSSIAPNDILVIINALNSGLDGDLSSQTPRDDGRFFDTNADGFLSPIDALLIINHLNRQASGEGEHTASLNEHSADAFDLTWIEDRKKSLRGRTV